jgi:hypothetical protein
MAEKLYKLRRKSDGLFYSGSGYKKKTWTKNGRSYTTKPMAFAAVRQAQTAARPDQGGWDTPLDPQDCELVEYDICEVAAHAL